MEIEVPFMILNNNRDFVNNKIKKVIEWVRYEANESGKINIMDRYYDTIDKTLKKNQINLRIRSIDNKSRVVTLKYEGGSNENYFDRFEIEEGWSSPLYEIILKKLKSLDLELKSEKLYHKDPEVTFRNFGLVEIMKKVSSRSLVNAVDKETNQIEFEFALDLVSIDTRYQNSINFLELEIESKRKGNQVTLKELTKKILEFSIFERWSFNKLETGLAIIHLTENKDLERSIDFDQENFLTKSGIEKIRSYLENIVK